MKSFAFFAATVLAVATNAFATPAGLENIAERAAALPAITIKGNAFFAGANRFYIRGVDYQPGGSSKLVDPLADATACARDIAEFQKLGINTVRIYTVDNSANHDACMQALAAAGIYLVLDVNTPKYSLNRATPAPSYNTVYLQNIFATIDAFASYTNTLAFFSGNEVINDDSTTSAAVYVKAVTRDMKGYIKARGYRSIPVGYSAADVDSNRMEMAHFMNCGTADERGDFFAFNDYSWCDPSSFLVSGWSQKVQNFTGYGIPIFLSEYGCIQPGPRTFQEVASLYSTAMTGVYSGGLVYEYSEEGQGYGLVTITGNTVTEGTGFTYLQTAFTTTPAPNGDGGYNAAGATSTCPPQSATWDVTSDTLPAIPSGAQALFTTGAGQGVGLLGTGSQNSGGQSTGSSSSTPSNAATTSKSTSPTPMRPYDPSSLVLGAIVLACAVFGATIF